jgi:hypothetical protein
MARIVFSDTGLQVHLPDPSKDPRWHDRGTMDLGDQSSFEGRLPVIYNPEEGGVYVGGPNWYHGDTYAHHNIENIGANLDGYFSGGPSWGDGKLKWWHNPPPEDHEAVAKALMQAGFDIPNPQHEEDPNDFNYEDDDDLWADDVPHTGSAGDEEYSDWS